jgi:Zn-dependent protease with chaperone function
MTAIPAPMAGGGRRPAARAPSAGVPTTRPDLPQRILDGLSARIEPVPVSLLYRVGMLLVMLAMLVLPLLYVALVAHDGYAVVWHAAHTLTVLAGRGGGRGRVFIYVAPIVIGGILLVFMVKPLFARRVRSHPPLALARDEEPLLFAFVERLCAIVCAPTPRAIHVDTDVNASAGFTGGIFGVLTNRLTLTIGLPLVAGLDLRQFAGVLAHEFGHFAQGSAMRVTFVVRSVNVWLARLVYDRDEWDYKLANTAADIDAGWFTVLVWVAQAAVWLTRRVLWVLMGAGHLISAFMLRQMEYDADRYEARVAGSDVFAHTCERINLLNVASQAAFADLGAAWRERRLCDNLPSLIRSRESQLPAEVRQVVRKHGSESRTGWLDSHPCDTLRIASAAAEAAPGIFKVNAPAAALFRDFAGLSRRATVAFYFQAVGEDFRPQNLVAAEEIVASSAKRRQDVTAMRRYFCDLVMPVRPVFPSRFDSAGAKPPRPDAAAERLLELRSTLCAGAPEAAAAARRFEEADDRLVALERVRELMTAGAKLPKVDLKKLGIARLDDDEVTQGVRAAARARDAARHLIDPLLAVGMERLTLALSLEKPATPAPSKPPTVEANDDADSYDLADEPPEGSDNRLLDALRVLRESAADVESLRRHFILLGTVLSQVQPGQNAQSLIDTCLWHSRKCSELLRGIHSILRGAPYPYAHANKKVTVAQYVTTSLPPAEEPVAVHNASDSATDAVYSLYVRLLSDLAARAEKVEEGLGLPALPDPPPKEPPPDEQRTM